MNVPAPWNLGTPAPKPGDPMRYRLSWVRDPQPAEAPMFSGVIMYNPAFEGEVLGFRVTAENGTIIESVPLIRDGATHRRVRSLLSDFTEIRVVNLSPIRGTRPKDARRADELTCSDPLIMDQQREAIRWACDADVVVAAWGGDPLTANMTAHRDYALHRCRDRLMCWGTTAKGAPLHPSPLGRIPKGATLKPYRSTT